MKMKNNLKKYQIPFNKELNDDIKNSMELIGVKSIREAFNAF